MCQDSQQLFDVQAQAGPTPFVIDFLQASVTESSQAQRAFEVAEGRLGDPGAAVELVLVGLGCHACGGALTDLFA